MLLATRQGQRQSTGRVSLKQLTNIQLETIPAERQFPASELWRSQPALVFIVRRCVRRRVYSA